MVLIIANGIPIICKNISPVSIPANIIAIGYLLYCIMLLNLFHFFGSLE